MEDSDTCGFTATGDQQNAIPWLGTLQDNGGDTLTYALKPGSPAIDAGLCVAGITTDQRAESRPHPGSSACDVGAYEADVGAATDVSIAKAVTPAVADPGDAVTYTLVFSNSSSETATGIVITDVVPTSVAGASFANSGATISHVGGTHYVWNASSLAPGESGVITITGVIKVPLAAGDLTNTAVITTTARDGDPDDNSASVGVTVRNVPPVAHDDTVPPRSEELPLSARLDASDDNGGALTYGILTSPVSGTVAIADPALGEFTYTPTNRTATYTDAFTYLVTDTGALTDTDEVVITVSAEPVNQAPTADAGDDQHVQVSETVTLDGSDSSDPDGDPLTYGWSQSGGTPVSFTSGVSVTTFTAPSSAGVLTFTLTVTDTGGLADPDTTVVAVSAYRIYLPLALRNR